MCHGYHVPLDVTGQPRKQIRVTGQPLNRVVLQQQAAVINDLIAAGNLEITVGDAMGIRSTSWSAVVRGDAVVLMIQPEHACMLAGVADESEGCGDEATADDC